MIRKLVGGPAVALKSPQKTGSAHSKSEASESSDRISISSESKESEGGHAGLGALVATWGNELKKSQKVQPTQQVQESRKLEKSRSQSASTTPHNFLGSKGAPKKTEAPRPIGAVEANRAARPDARVGLRQTQLAWASGPKDMVDFSAEVKSG